jgi:DNA polymerase-2
MLLAPDVDPEYVEPTRLHIELGEEKRTLSLRNPVSFIQRLEKLIRSYDPDIILTKWGDTWIFPYALSLAAQYNVAFNPNRDTSRAAARRAAFSYHTYGRVLHRGEQVHLFGRWHIDQTNAVMYGEYKLTGILEQAAITGLPVQEVARKSPGAGITAMQMISAMKKGILIPFHKQQTENFKTPAQLVTSDRGGLVGQPQTGIHYHVAGIDFFSMYPQIMARFNISPETITSKENTQTIRVPGTKIYIDQNTTGFIGESLQALLIRRHLLKQQLAKTHPFDTRYPNLDARSNALKWLLVVCFGYLGHKHFRWMKIEAHEAVTAFGREMLLQAKEIAERHGFRVLYFNVDGLYVQKQGASQPEDFSHLLAAVRAQTGLNISLDGIYRWIVFLPSRTNPAVPVANRYFGLFQNGKIKVRGIEMRRHDTPTFVHKVQAELLHLLTQTREGEPLESMAPAAIRLLEQRAQDLRDGVIPLTDLIISQRLSREVSQYRQPSPAAKAASQLKEMNKPLHAGQVVHFLFVEGKPGVLAWRAGFPFQYGQVKVREYLKLLIRAASNILQPLGIQEDTLGKLLAISGQLPLGFEDNSLIAQIDLPEILPRYRAGTYQGLDLEEILLSGLEISVDACVDGD